MQKIKDFMQFFYEENKIIDREIILKNENTKQRYNLLLKEIGIAKI